MTNEHNAFDLAALAKPTEQERWVDAALGPKVDLSGKPKPENVRVRMASGIEFKCDVRYDGLDPDRTRRFKVIAEIDWADHFPVALIVGEYPSDVTIIFDASNVPDGEDQMRASHLRVLPEKVIQC